jgi:membrane protease subunit HflC
VPITAPGLHWKVPFIDSVVYIDNRILDLENPSQEVIAADQKRLVVDAFARYRISNPLKFYQAVGSIEAANSRLATVLNSALRRVLGESTFISVVRDEREGLMARISEQVNREAANFGITVVDVRIRRADLPEANSQAVFQRMQTERQREAAEIRAQGNEAAQRTRARAEREATIIVAEANSRGEQVRGQGDAERNKIFAEAYNRDPTFFTFYRSMQAYETSLKPGETRILISPDASSFFRYFADPLGGAPTASQDVLPPVPAGPTNGAGAPAPVVPVVPPAQPAR